MSTEVANQISTLLDRISRQKEEDFKTMVQTTTPPNPFSGLVFVDHETQSLATNSTQTLTAGLSSTAAENFFTCKVYSLDGHHDGIDNPISVKTESEYRTAVNASFNGVIRIDHENLKDLSNGSVWKCTLKGGMVTLDTVEQRTSFTFNPNKRAQLVNQGPSTSAQNAHQGGGKQPQIEYQRPENARIELRFKANSLKTQASQIQYKTFLDTFIIKLSLTNFSNTFVTVNSLKRSPASQASAMVDTRFYGSAETMKNFRVWYKDNYTSYGTRGTASHGLWQIIKKTWTSPQGLKKALTAEIKKQVAKGQYISKHLRAGAVDLNTNKQTFDDVKIMLEVVKEMKPYLVSYYKWESVSTASLQAKRKKDGVYNTNEHLHVNLTNTGTGGE